jgi:hypothetical protein
MGAGIARPSDLMLSSISRERLSLFLGALGGGVMALYLSLRDAPPWHIERWRVGHEGERRTAKVLRELNSDWTVWHDVPGRKGTNIDHVVLGPSGLYLLDSKNYSGEGHVEGRALEIRWLEDPGAGWSHRRLIPRMRAANATLKEQVQEVTGLPLWVQPVVVLWMHFPGESVEVDGIRFIRGGLLGEWLSSRRAGSSPQDSASIAHAVDHLLSNEVHLRSGG